MDDRARSPARYLAPVALIAATLLLVVVIAGSGGGEDGAPATQSAGRVEERAGGDRERRADAETYEVQDGDTLDAISDETGVSVEQLQELNPDLDPQSLVAGQELRLSE